jgi:vitamin B12 transporter
MNLNRSLCLALALAGFTAQAQTIQRDTTTNLNEVLIKENRIRLPFSQQNRNLTIIDQQKIKSLPVRSVSELLSFVSGVDVRQRGPAGSQADIGMDGGTFDQTLVLLNGVKVSDPQTGHNMMNLPVSIDDIDHIEVLRGSASRIYGLNAITGAINIVTRTAVQSGVSANVFAGSSLKKDEVSGDAYANYGIRATGDLVLKSSSHMFSAGRKPAMATATTRLSTTRSSTTRDGLTPTQLTTSTSWRAISTITLAPMHSMRRRAIKKRRRV